MALWTTSEPSVPVENMAAMIQTAKRLAAC